MGNRSVVIENGYGTLFVHGMTMSAPQAGERARNSPPSSRVPMVNPGSCAACARCATGKTCWLIADGLRCLSAELGLGEVRGRGLLLALELGTDGDRG